MKKSCNSKSAGKKIPVANKSTMNKYSYEVKKPAPKK